MSTTPAPDASADFDRATRQALRLLAPCVLRPVISQSRTTVGPATPEDSDIEALAVALGILTPAPRRH